MLRLGAIGRITGLCATGLCYAVIPQKGLVDGLRGKTPRDLDFRSRCSNGGPTKRPSFVKSRDRGVFRSHSADADEAECFPSGEAQAVNPPAEV